MKKLSKPIAIIFDEFTYLVQSDPATPSILQKYWDEYLKNLPILVVVTGSFVGMIEKQVIGGRAALYGRSNSIVELEEMTLPALQQFLSGYTLRQLVETYALVGGVPAYVRLFRDDLSIAENIRANFLERESFLANDIFLLLREELEEPRTYFAVLRAISHGKTKLNEICGESGLAPSVANKYLSVLGRMKLVRREVPVTEQRPHKSKRGIFKLSSNYYSFWFRFIYENQSLIEEDRGEYLLTSIVMPNLDSYVGSVYEEVARHAIVEMAKKGTLPFNPTRIGSWWHKGDEIDIVALNDKSKEVLFCEVKWSDLSSKEAEALLRQLKEKVARVDWNRLRRREYRMLICRELKGEAPTEGMILRLPNVFTSLRIPE